MACDPQTLANEAECYACGLSEKGLLGAIAYLVCIWSGGGPTPPSGNGITTEGGDKITTEGGDVIIIQ